MREHMGLFRGKRLDNGEWIEGHYVCLKYVYYDKREHLITHRETGVSYTVDPDTIGECTGLRDKNGKLIFEGDIVREFYNGKCVVKYGRHKLPCCGCCYDYHESVGFYLKDKWDSPHSDDEAWHGLEIIGNIHDNPELLKGGEGNG